MANLPTLPPRKPDSHKGDFGRAILIGGSRGMSGAITLSGMACLRSGAGLVKLAVPDVCLETVAAHSACLMTVPLPCDSSGRLLVSESEIRDLCANATCVAFGPGAGQSEKLNDLAEWLYTSYAGTLVVDADGLNALAHRDSPLASPAGPRIVTPHPGEFARLSKQTAKLTWDEQAEVAKQLAAEHGTEHGLVIVLKGGRSLITDGTRNERNTTGNPGMAKGGAGDVLTGIITALVCQGLSPVDAAHLGCHLHGLAGDLAAKEYGEVSMLATDLIEKLPKAFSDRLLSNA